MKVRKPKQEVVPGAMDARSPVHRVFLPSAALIATCFNPSEPDYWVSLAYHALIRSNPLRRWIHRQIHRPFKTNKRLEISTWNRMKKTRKKK